MGPRWGRILAMFAMGIASCSSGSNETPSADTGVETATDDHQLTPSTAADFVFWVGSSSVDELPKINDRIVACSQRASELEATVSALYRLLDNEWKSDGTTTTVRDGSYGVIVLKILAALKTPLASSEAERRVWWPLPALVVSDDPVPDRLKTERLMITAVMVMRCGGASDSLMKIRTDHESSDVRGATVQPMSCVFDLPG